MKVSSYLAYKYRNGITLTLTYLFIHATEDFFPPAASCVFQKSTLQSEIISLADANNSDFADVWLQAS